MGICDSRIVASVVVNESSKLLLLIAVSNVAGAVSCGSLQLLLVIDWGGVDVDVETDAAVVCCGVVVCGCVETV